MTPEAQRIAIAEACGWKRNQFPDIAWSHGDLVHASSVRGLPDYLNDLNAIHEAEKICIVGSFDMEYREDLEPLCGQYAVIYHATAAQRAEAFLKTLGLWED
jgi:hypothetical protein